MPRSIRRRASQEEPDDSYQPEPAETDEDYTAPRTRRSAGEKTARIPRREPDDPPARGMHTRLRRPEPEPPTRRAARDVTEPPRRTADRRPDRVPERAAREQAPAHRAGVTASRGWGSYARVKKETSNFPENLQVSEEQFLVMFLEAEPFLVYREHWIDRLEGRKSRTCAGEACPLCEIGDSPRMRVCFNVVDWSVENTPVVKVWQVGSRLAETIHNFSESSKTGPLNKPGLYWAVSRSGKGTKTEYALVPVKERDLDEDWDRDPLDDTEITELLDTCYDDSLIRTDPIEELEEVADELNAEDLRKTR